MIEPPRTTDDVLARLAARGALLTGHFKLSSGRHADKYLQCALLLQYPDEADSFGRALARALLPHRPEVIASPAAGGMIIGQTTAAGLGVRALFAERGETGFVLRRGFSIKPGERVAVVDDVFTTGLSVREVITAARGLGGDVVAVGAIVDRSSPDEKPLGVSLVALARVIVPSWDADECPLCARGLPVEKPGSRPG